MYRDVRFLEPLLLYKDALILGLIIGVVVGLRKYLEASMWQHMLIQLPIIGFFGFLVAKFLPDPIRSKISNFNRYGLTGFTFYFLATSLWMIPSALDLAVSHYWVDCLKVFFLVMSGFLLRISWVQGGATIQAFFFVGWAMMTATVGLIYQDSSIRLCNYYLVDDQIVAGKGLVLISFVVTTVWFLNLLVSNSSKYK